MDEIDRLTSQGGGAAVRIKSLAPATNSESPTPFGSLLLRAPGAGAPIAVRRAQMLSVQRTAGNRAAQRLATPGVVSLQRKAGALGRVKAAVGMRGSKRSVADKVEGQAAKAQSATVVTVADLEKQISNLESMMGKLSKAHQPGDSAGQRAASQVQAAANRILGNLPDQDSKASKVLGRTYPAQVRRLRRVVDESQLILDEVRVESSRRQAQDIYLEAGRTANAGQQGALTKLTVRHLFDQAPDRPAPNAEVAAYLAEHGFRSYEDAFEDALSQTASNPDSGTEGQLQRMQPQLFKHAERSRSRTSATAMGLSAAELAAIQTYTAQDYRYINPAAANDPGWLAANFPDLADQPNKSLEEWAELQDLLAAEGQSLEQRLAERQKQLTAFREEGGLHTGVALKGLRKMPPWKGLAYRGENAEGKRFYPRYVRHGDSFLPRNPTFSWKTITSISKSEVAANTFMSMGSGNYQVMYEFEITNGRDIEGLSVNRREREIALLPGAEFAYGPIQVVQQGKFVEGFGEVPWRLRIKAKQIK
jgi:hypothetical protein